MKELIRLLLPTTLFLIWSVEVQAATRSINWVKVAVDVVPVLLFIITFFGILKWSQKKVNDVNKKIIESNEEVARQVKRIADHLEKNS